MGALGLELAAPLPGMLPECSVPDSASLTHSLASNRSLLKCISLEKLYSEHAVLNTLLSLGLSQFPLIFVFVLLSYSPCLLFVPMPKNLEKKMPGT